MNLQIFEEQVGKYLILRCPKCGLFFHYTMSWGKWKLQKVSQMYYKDARAIKT